MQELFAAQSDNPGLYANQYEGALDCLKRKGVVPSSTSLKAYVADEKKLEKDSNAEVMFDAKSPDYRSCLAANGTRFAE